MLNYDEHQELTARYAACMQAEDQVRRLRYAERFAAAGKTTPAMRAPELALLETFSDKQLELYAALKQAQPPVC
jgi:hypothetical protein